MLGPSSVVQRCSHCSGPFFAKLGCLAPISNFLSGAAYSVALKITIMRLKMPFLHGRPFVVYGISFVSANQNDGRLKKEYLPPNLVKMSPNWPN